MNRRISFLVFLMLGIVGLPTYTHASTLLFSPSAVQVTVGDRVNVIVQVSSPDVAINNVSAVIGFPVDTLRVDSLSTAGSLLSLWVEPPTYSNDTGEVTFNGGIPTPGFIGARGRILSVAFIARKAGIAHVSLSGASILANDGLGTETAASQNPSGIDITIIDPVPRETPSALALVQTPQLATTVPTTSLSPVAITSSTHPVESVWYRTATATLAWILPDAAVAVETGHGKTLDTLSWKRAKALITQSTLPLIGDGTTYFAVRYVVNTGVKSPVQTYRLNLDTEPPVFSESSVTYDEEQQTLHVRAFASDTRSGIAHYEVSIDGGVPSIVDPDALGQRMFGIPYEVPGEHDVTVHAVDGAGNIAETHATFIVPKPLAEKTIFRIGSFGMTFGGLLVCFAFLLLLTLAVAIESRYQLIRLRAAHVHLREPLKRDMHHGLDEFKKEIEDALVHLNTAKSKRELTQEEDRLHQALSSDLADLRKYLDMKVDTDI